MRPILRSNSSMVCLNSSEPPKAAEPIEMPFGIWTWVDSRKHVLGEVSTGATWQIQLNRPCAAAMRPVVKLL